MTTKLGRNLLIGAILLLASVQIVRVYFYISSDYIDVQNYASGTAKLPYQARASMVPVLVWARDLHLIRSGATRYALMLSAGRPLLEQETPEKFASMIVGMLALLALVAGASWYGWNCCRYVWWLVPALLLCIANVMLTLHVMQSIWYPYDLPHAALFGLAIFAALQNRWWMVLLCFIADVPTRETSVFLLPLILPVLWVNGDVTRGELLQRRAWREVATERRTQVVVLIGAIGFLFWAAVQAGLQHHYAGNIVETGSRFARNFHEIFLPQHVPQIFGAGGYLPIFVWLARKRLPLPERLMLYGSLPCIPVVMYFGIWSETRIWLEWTALLAAAATLELCSLSWHSTTAPEVQILH